MKFKIESRRVLTVDCRIEREYIHNYLGKLVEVLPKGEVEYHLTFEDGNTEQVYNLDMNEIDGKRLLVYNLPEFDSYGGTIHISSMQYNWYVAVGNENMKFLTNGTN